MFTNLPEEVAWHQPLDSVTTGRATGNQVTQYQYYTTPGTASTHGQLHYVIESPGAGQATTELNYDSRGNVSRSRRSGRPDHAVLLRHAGPLDRRPLSRS